MSGSPQAASIRRIDPRGQRFGAGLSAIVLIVAAILGAWVVVPLVGLALTVSAARGTRYLIFGRPWPLVRRTLGLPSPAEPEWEIPPRFAQALGATFLALATIAFILGWTPIGWFLTLAVAALQTLLAVTGFCLGCRLYGLKWYVPSLFDRVLGVPPVPRTRLVPAGAGRSDGGDAGS